MVEHGGQWLLGNWGVPGAPVIIAARSASRSRATARSAFSAIQCYWSVIIIIIIIVGGRRFEVIQYPRGLVELTKLPRTRMRMCWRAKLPPVLAGSLNIKAWSMPYSATLVLP